MSKKRFLARYGPQLIIVHPIRYNTGPLESWCYHLLKAYSSSFDSSWTQHIGNRKASLELFFLRPCSLKVAYEPVFLDIAYQGILAIPLWQHNLSSKRRTWPLYFWRWGQKVSWGSPEWKRPGRFSVIFQNTKFVYLCPLIWRWFLVGNWANECRAFCDLPCNEP